MVVIICFWQKKGLIWTDLVTKYKGQFKYRNKLNSITAFKEINNR